MAEYIEREAILAREYLGYTRYADTEWQKGYWDGVDDIFAHVKSLPAADVIPTPLKYAAMTNIHDGEEYTLDLSIPITKKQFDAIANGTDIWEVLKNG